jgi:hypothetical protein
MLPLLQHAELLYRASRRLSFAAASLTHACLSRCELFALLPAQPEFPAAADDSGAHNYLLHFQIIETEQRLLHNIEGELDPGNITSVFAGALDPALGLFPGVVNGPFFSSAVILATANTGAVGF